MHHVRRITTVHNCFVYLRTVHDTDHEFTGSGCIASTITRTWVYGSWTLTSPQGTGPDRRPAGVKWILMRLKNVSWLNQNVKRKPKTWHLNIYYSEGDLELRSSMHLTCHTADSWTWLNQITDSIRGIPRSCLHFMTRQEAGFHFCYKIKCPPDAEYTSSPCFFSHQLRGCGVMMPPCIRTDILTAEYGSKSPGPMQATVWCWLGRLEKWASYTLWSSWSVVSISLAVIDYSDHL